MLQLKPISGTDAETDFIRKDPDTGKTMRDGQSGSSSLSKLKLKDKGSPALLHGVLTVRPD